MTIGEKILIRRKELGLSQEQLAEQLKVSRQSISKWEQNGALPDFINGITLCNLLNITPAELINSEPLPVPTKKEIIPTSFMSIEVLIVKIVLIVIVFAVFGKLSKDLNAYNSIHYTYSNLSYLYLIAPYFFAGIIFFYKTILLTKSMEMWVFELILLATIGFQAYLMYNPLFSFYQLPWLYRVWKPIGLLTGTILVLAFNSTIINRKTKK